MPMTNKNQNSPLPNNRERGYALESWQMQSVLIADSGEMNETIIAVFVKK